MDFSNLNLARNCVASPASSANMNPNSENPLIVAIRLASQPRAPVPVKPVVEFEDVDNRQVVGAMLQTVYPEQCEDIDAQDDPLALWSENIHNTITRGQRHGQYQGWVRGSQGWWNPSATRMDTSSSISEIMARPSER